MSRHLLSINVATIQEFSYRRKIVTTGIFKQPVTAPTQLHTLNLAGDQQADLTVHGGPYKAVYFYPYEHYAHWQTYLGRAAFGYGQFGENFTVTGMTETDVMIGDIYRLGAAVVQITQPRSPCFKLTHKLQAPADFSRAFLQSGYTGFYARVLQEGSVEPNTPIELIEQNSEQVSVQALNHLVYLDPSDIELARRGLRLEALAPGWRDSLTEIVLAADLLGAATTATE
jgi:MOSC domain-containing protein YiiM